MAFILFLLYNLILTPNLKGTCLISQARNSEFLKCILFCWVSCWPRCGGGWVAEIGERVNYKTNEKCIHNKTQKKNAFHKNAFFWILEKKRQMQKRLFYKDLKKCLQKKRLFLKFQKKTPKLKTPNFETWLKNAKKKRLPYYHCFEGPDSLLSIRLV